MVRHVYGKISEVADGSPAARAGLKPGDELIALNSKPARDILEYSYASAEESITIDIYRDGERYSFAILKDADEDLGLGFEEELFDGLHTCKNSCVFCFLHQMPKGLRRSLYMKDDDFRLSFAHGNYITLTNMTDAEFDRICSQRMSPMYISVHATDPALRIQMLRSRKAGQIMDQLRRLAAARITMHTQIVLCPGINDGKHLERTVHDLASLHPWVASIAIVPVGLTKHRERLTPLTTVNPALAWETVDASRTWQKDFLQRMGTRLVFPSDELYLLSGIEFPDADAYEGFPQLEDGIGVSRIFMNELEELVQEAGQRSLSPGRYVLVTGVLATPLVERLASFLNRFDGITARVCVVTNKYLGETVTVAGLLTGQDISMALEDSFECERILIPNIGLNEDKFLDDMTLAQLNESVRGSVVEVAPSPRAVVELLSSCADEFTGAAGTGR